MVVPIVRETTVVDDETPGQASDNEADADLDAEEARRELDAEADGAEDREAEDGETIDVRLVDDVWDVPALLDETGLEADTDREDTVLIEGDDARADEAMLWDRGCDEEILCNVDCVDDAVARLDVELMWLDKVELVRV